MVLEQTLYPSWSSIFDSFYEFHWIYKAKEWQFKTFLAKMEKFWWDAFTVYLYYRGFSDICWKNKCYKRQVPSIKITLLRCLEINFYINFHNQLKKVWDTAIWGQNSSLNFPKNVEIWWKLRWMFWPQMAVSQTFFNWLWKFT